MKIKLHHNYYYLVLKRFQEEDYLILFQDKYKIHNNLLNHNIVQSVVLF